MLVAGADTSDNDQYVAIVVGEAENVDRIHGRLGVPHIHMTKFASRREKQNIAQSLALDGCIRSACFKIDRPKIIQRVERQRNKGGEFAQRRRIQVQFNYALRKRISEVFSEFVSSNGTSLSEIVFQVDHDLQETLQSTGLRCGLMSKAHELADIVGWANHASMQIENVLEFDFTKDIEEYVLERVAGRG